MPPQHNFLRELQEHNDFFDSFVDMFPDEVYVTSNRVEDRYNSKYFKGQNKKSQETRRAKAKTNKRAKLNSAEEETTTNETTDSQQTLIEDKTEKITDTGFLADISNTDKPADSLKPTDSPKPKEISSSSSRIEALRAKLHAKLAEKRGNRPTNSNSVSKRAARRAEKQKRQEEAKKRKAGTKVDTLSVKQYIVGKDPSKETDLAKIDFGKLAGLDKHRQHTDNKSLANLNKKKNLQKMLADAEEKKKRLEELKRSDLDVDKEKADKIVWTDALREASGKRTKDDPKKIKKVIKQKIAKKEKSAKAWKNRMQQTKQKMDDRQKMRSHNLDKRRQGGAVGANLSKKRIVEEPTKEAGNGENSTRKSRAGFEGKKTGFLNSKPGSSGKSPKSGSSSKSPKSGSSGKSPKSSSSNKSQ